MALAAGINIKAGMMTRFDEVGLQRQHIRIRLPAKAEIGDKIYNIENLSAGGFSIRTGRNFRAPQKAGETRIHFPFESFAFHLKAKATPVYYDEKKQIAGFRFSEISEKQDALLSHIVHTHIGGVSPGQDVITIARPDEDVPVIESEAVGNDNQLRGMPESGFGLFIWLKNIFVRPAIPNDPDSKREPDEER